VRRGLRRAEYRARQRPQRVPRPAVGHAARDNRAGAPEAAPGDVLPELAARAAATGGTGARGRGGRELRARGLDAEGRGPGADARHRAALEVAGVGVGEEPGHASREFPGATAGRRALPVRVARCRCAPVPRGRAYGACRSVDRGRGERGGQAGSAGPRGRDRRGWRRMAGLCARPGRPRPRRRAARDLGCASGAAAGGGGDAARGRMATLSDGAVEKRRSVIN